MIADIAIEISEIIKEKSTKLRYKNKKEKERDMAERKRVVFLLLNNLFLCIFIEEMGSTHVEDHF